MLTGLFLVSCQADRPDKIFGKAILNTNLIAGFNPEIYGERLEKGGEAQKSVDIQIQVIEKAIRDIKDIKTSDEDSKALKEQSIKLFETVLPVYKNEYSAYAKLYAAKDSSPEEKQALLKKIEQNYLPKTNVLFDELYNMGQQYQINVKWGR
ncbi:hypothetical protein EH151_04290 [Elizabethkingia anophelis]|uniref:hypothetical protein n=1 Tax=Elizabethkingia anophelis TaxID=1117645 RepID=UPI00136C0FC9|nr:hypothetical protein [Elizabethkingia anophelis]MYZ59111.1 hypothetical protein [Elizabethkingia anophelis]